ncbi:MAG: dihydroorotase [Treponema sp.]|nr:dihydroorotase [Treponema sp.]
MKTIVLNVRVVDEEADMPGAVIIEDGLITGLIPQDGTARLDALACGAAADAAHGAARIIDGRHYALPGGRLPVLMPALVDLHAHFRDPGFPEKETLESASLAAVAGGYGTVVCMANTRPVIDTPEAAALLRDRARSLGLIDLYPVLALTRNMEGRELSAITTLRRGAPSAASPYIPRMLSEDGKDLADDTLFRAAFAEARRLGIPVSCHCDAGGAEAEAARKAGKPREVWSRIEENTATRRAIKLGQKEGCHVHIAHVSTREALDMIRRAKGEGAVSGPQEPSPQPSPGADLSAGFRLTCEAAPHHIALTEADARSLGAESLGRVNPPLRTAEDRRAIVAGVLDGTVDALATDHAPHTGADKAGGMPGFTGLETSFAVCRTELVREGGLTLSRLSSLMSAKPARLLGLTDRGRITPGLRADLILTDPGASWKPGPESFRSRGKNSPFIGRDLSGKILLTIHQGRIVFEG